MARASLRELRLERLLSQEELADSSGISIKTIQRLENGHSKGSAYTLKEIAKALDVDPIELSPADGREEVPAIAEEDGRSIVRVMNLSALLVLLVPLSNVIVPLIIFLKFRHHSLVDKVGRRILTVQILCTLFSVGVMVVLPLLVLLILNGNYAGGMPLFVPAYLFSVFINVLVTLAVAIILSKGRQAELKLPNLL